MNDNCSEGFRDRVWPMVSMWFFLGSCEDFSLESPERNRASSAGGMNSMSLSDWCSDGVLNYLFDEFCELLLCSWM